MVSERPDSHQLPQPFEANLLVVQDVIQALQTLAGWHRLRFSLPVVGITGSNGKTIIKEWLYQLLHTDLRIVRSPKSFNSQIGVPLSLWQISEADQLALIEAGISRTGEMEVLASMIRPETGILAYMGTAHAEGFSGQAEKIREKLSLFAHSSLLVYCRDDESVENEVKAFVAGRNPLLRTFTWSYRSPADLRLALVRQDASHTCLEARFGTLTFTIDLPLTDQASLFNAMTCLAYCLSQGYDPVRITERMHELRPLEMRLELKKGIRQSQLINDSYSTDLDSLYMALDFLSRQGQRNRTTVILSDILQSSLSGPVLYGKVAEALRQHGILRLIGVGSDISACRDRFSGITETLFFDTTEALIAALEQIDLYDHAILIKGARRFGFERIDRLLEWKHHDTVMEVQLPAMRRNLRQYRQKLSPGVRIMAMVKAFSYGSGTHEVAFMLQHEGVDYLAVAYTDEGVELRKAGVRLPIMVMNPSESDFEDMLTYKLEPELYSLRSLHACSAFLRKRKQTAFPVHIKLDTGMHRLGFTPDEREKLIHELCATPEFHVVSLFSHLVASEDPTQDAFTRHQVALFSQMADPIEQALGYRCIRHISNSSAIHRHPDLQWGMVRLGIGLYGADERMTLEQVATLKTVISQIKRVAAGESVGYGRKGVVHRDSTIATVRIGYADGYPRSLGQGAGRMLVRGVQVPVIGHVCMDMTMLDITGVEAAEGDEVIVFGESLPVTALSRWAGTIPYEILTGISQRVKRIYYDE